MLGRGHQVCVSLTEGKAAPVARQQVVGGVRALLQGGGLGQAWVREKASLASVSSKSGSPPPRFTKTGTKPLYSQNALTLQN